MKAAFSVSSVKSLAAFAIAGVGIFGPWAEYQQLAVGITPVTIALLIASALLALLVVMTGRLKRISGFHIASGLFLVWMGISYLWTMVPERWPLYFLYYLTSNLVLLAVISALDSPTRWRWACLAFGMGALIASLLVFQAALQGNVLQDNRYSVNGLNNNYVAYSLVASISVLLTLVVRWSMRGLALLGVFLVIGLLLGAIYLTGSRGALLASSLVIAWFVTSRIVGRGALVFAYAVFAVLLLVVPMGLIDALALRLFDADFARMTGDLSGRLVIWPIAKMLIENNFVFGVGPGAFSALNSTEIGAHNLLLTLLLDGGFIGLLLFMLIHWLAVAPAFKANASHASIRVAGLFLCYWGPIVLTGHWEAAPLAWFALGVHAIAMNDRALNWASVSRVAQRRNFASRPQHPDRLPDGFPVAPSIPLR